MSKTEFNTTAGAQHRTLEEWAAIGLHREAKRLAGRNSKLIGKVLDALDDAIAGLVPDQKYTAALWGVLGSDEPGDKYVGQKGSVGIAHMIMWGLREGQLLQIKPFLSWALCATHGPEREHILCEALRHPETVSLLKPLLPEIFREMVYPPLEYHGQPPIQTSSGFVNPVWAAARYPELHPLIDAVLPAALERELRWLPTNFASLVLGRYHNERIPETVYPLVQEMASLQGAQLEELCTTACITLIKRLQEEGDDTTKRALSKFAVRELSRDVCQDQLDATPCLLLAVEDDGTVSCLYRGTQYYVLHGVIHQDYLTERRIARSNGPEWADLYPRRVGDVVSCLDELAGRAPREIASVASHAAETVRRIFSPSSAPAPLR